MRQPLPRWNFLDVFICDKCLRIRVCERNSGLPFALWIRCRCPERGKMRLAVRHEIPPGCIPTHVEERVWIEEHDHCGLTKVPPGVVFVYSET